MKMAESNFILSKQKVADSFLPDKKAGCTNIRWNFQEKKSSPGKSVS